MKKLIKIAIVAIVGIIIILASVYAYYGGFKSVQFETKEAGGEILVYQELTGDYSQTSLYMDTVYYSLLNDYGIETKKGAGLYFDNPQHVEKSKLRSEIGCILDSPIEDSIKIANISSKFKIKVLPEGRHIVTKFPFKGTMSVIVGIIKIYPALNEYLEKNSYKANGPVTEIYDIPNKVITYRQKIEK